MEQSGSTPKTIVIFGGCGFIGIHLTAKFLSLYPNATIYLADINTVPTFVWPKIISEATASGRIKIIHSDVRKSISQNDLPQNVDLIVNLAAVHKQPGHQEHEYYDTNIPGAENISSWANLVNCKNIIFTSSIAVYGVDEIHPESKTEESIPMPVSPYGKSKIKAESIHQDWTNKASDNKLLIVRPGVIFGHGENGNVTRMINAVLHRYFVFIGNEQVKKAGGYVKELCESIIWMMGLQNKNQTKVLLYNFTMSPAPTIMEYTKAITEAAHIRRTIPRLPYGLLYFVAYVFGNIAKVLKINTPINAERVKKLKQANIIEPVVLLNSGYQYKFNLLSALKDWKNEWPEDWK